MKNRVLITSVLLLSVIGVNRVFAQKYENNRYGLTLEKKENGYVLKDAKTIERLEVFDIEKAPADMFDLISIKCENLNPKILISVRLSIMYLKNILITN